MQCLLQMLALRMQATTSDQAKQQQETSLYSSSSDASECGSEGDESVEDSDPDGMNTRYFIVAKHVLNLNIEEGVGILLLLVVVACRSVWR